LHSIALVFDVIENLKYAPISSSCNSLHSVTPAIDVNELMRRKRHSKYTGAISSESFLSRMIMSPRYGAAVGGGMCWTAGNSCCQTTAV